MRAAQWRQEEDILERLLARSWTEAVRWTGAGRLCGRGRGRSIGEAVVSTVPRLVVVNPNLLRASPDWTHSQTSSAGLPLDGLQQSMLLLREARHGKLDSLTRVLLRMMLALLVLLLLREEEVRLGGAIGLPKGGHGYRQRVFRAAPSLAAGSRRDVGSVLALA